MRKIIKKHTAARKWRFQRVPRHLKGQKGKLNHGWTHGKKFKKNPLRRMANLSSRFNEISIFALRFAASSSLRPDSKVGQYYTQTSYFSVTQPTITSSAGNWSSVNMEAQQEDEKMKHWFDRASAKEPEEWSVGSDGGFRCRNWLFVPDIEDLRKYI